MKKAGIILFSLVQCLGISGQDQKPKSSSDLLFFAGSQNCKVQKITNLSGNSQGGADFSVKQLDNKSLEKETGLKNIPSISDSSMISLTQVVIESPLQCLRQGSDWKKLDFGTGLSLLNQGGNETSALFGKHVSHPQKLSFSFAERDDWLFFEISEIEGDPNQKRVTIKSFLPKYLPVNFKESSIESEKERELQIINELTVTKQRHLESRKTGVR